MLYLTCICALCLFIFAPEQYSYEFCLACFALFLYDSYKLIKNDVRRINTVNFNLLYLFSFFFCTYAFPVFLMPIGQTGYLYKSSVMSIHESAINACTAMATLFISIYTCGYLSQFKSSIKAIDVQKIPKNKIIDIVLVFVTFFYSVSILVFIGRNADAVAMTETPFFLVIYHCFLVMSLVNNNFENKHKRFLDVIKKNKVPIATSLLIVLLMLYMGDRGPIISIGLIYLGVYSIYIRKLPFRILLILCVVGVAFMYLIGVTRAGSSSIRAGGVNSFVSASKDIVEENSGTLWTFFSDFTGRYIELYSGYYYKEKNGLLYPIKIIPLIGSPIPLMPNLLSRVIFGKSWQELSSVKAINGVIFKDRDGWFGTHCVMDIYMSWGIVGVILFSLIQGIVFGKISRDHNKNFLFAALYIILLSKALYLPRSVFYEWYRPICWMIFIYFISNRLK